MKQQTRTYSITDLRELWSMLFGGKEVPAESQWALWFLLHDPNIVRKGIVQLAAKHRKLAGQMDATYMAKFASSVMNRLTRQAHNQPALSLGD